MVDIKKGRNMFYVGDTEENPLAKITFTNEDTDKIIVDHTFVSEKLRGQKVANELVKTIIEFARKENKKIIPKCTYVKAQFDKNKDYADVLYKENIVG